MIFDKVLEFSNFLVQQLEVTGIPIPSVNGNVPWKDYVYMGENYRRAHVNIVDARDKNLFMLHCCIFPNINDSSPIFGLDIIAGPSRISGAFHDFSKTVDQNHFMMQWFENFTSVYVWKKPRNLPDWASEIFSPSIVAIGAVNTEKEISQLLQLFSVSLDYYISNVGNTVVLGSDYTSEQNRYCYFQKKNPHNPRVMQNLGLSESEAVDYVDKIMFPEMDIQA